jgi:hypothetical protein
MIVLNMEKGQEAYSMVLGRAWLKLPKAQHDWGNNTLTITSKDKEMILNTTMTIRLNLAQHPRQLDDGYD